MKSSVWNDKRVRISRPIWAKEFEKATKHKHVRNLIKNDPASDHRSHCLFIHSCVECPKCEYQDVYGARYAGCDNTYAWQKLNQHSTLLWDRKSY